MPTLHIVPHTHWDREWYLPFQVMRVKLVHLVDRLLDLLATSPEYRHFTLDGQTIVVEDYLRIRPERRGEIVGHVATGRLLVGPWTVLPDEFLVSPESLVRNLQRGTRAAAELGGCMDVGYVPDPFGHVGQLPQILRGFGIDRAAFRRGLSDEPCELRWEAPDGSRVLVAYLREGYDNAATLPDDPEAFAAVVRRRGERLDRHSSVSHLLLMNGTDHHEPQPGLGRLIQEAKPDGDRWILSTLPSYLRAVAEEVEANGIELPVVHGELRSPKRHHLLPGVLSSRVWIKQRNDACEQALETWAEPFSGWAEILCARQTDPPVFTGHVETPRVRGARALLDEAWRLLLECHPHDSICGCSVDAVHDEMRSRFDQVDQIAEEVTRQGLRALAGEVDSGALAPTGARQALVVFNPSRRAGPAVARGEVELAAGLDRFEVVDGDGRLLPHREISRTTEELASLEFPPAEVLALVRGVSDGRIAGLAVQHLGVTPGEETVGVELVVSEHGEPCMESVESGLAVLDRALSEPGVERVRVRARFASRVSLEVGVPDLPPHGYRAFGLRPAGGRSAGTTVDEIPRIANEEIEVEASPDGTVGLRDRRTGLSVSGLLRLSDEADRGDSYNFCPVQGDVPIRDPVTPARVRRERSPVGERLVIESELSLPLRLEPERDRRTPARIDVPVAIRIDLAPGDRHARVEIELDNRAEDHRLRLLLPLGTAVATALYDGHYEVVSRPTATETPGEGWSEHPVPEQPMRAFVSAAPPGGPGLAVAAHGIREASVSPDGVIALTLLRCFGWLSRDDLATRVGPAGPALPTPGGQSPGSHAFRLALIPFAGNPLDVVAEADAFRARPRVVGAPIGAGGLPAAGSLLRIDSPEFRPTAIQPERGGDALVVRGVWLGEADGRVRVVPIVPPRAAERVRLDGTPLGAVPVVEGAVALDARPNEVVSVRLRFDRT